MSTRGRGIDFDATDAALRSLRVSAPELAGPAGVAAAGALLERLDPQHLVALRALVDLGGAAPVLLAVDEIADEIGQGSVEARRAAEHALLALWEAGIVARDRASRTFFLVPDFGAALVPSLRERLVSSLPPTEPALPAIDEHLLICAVNVLRHEPLKLTREDLPFKRSLETLADKLKAELPRKDPLSRVDMLVATLLDLDMLQRRGDTLEIQTAAAEEWAHAGRERRERRILATDPSGLAAFVLAQIRDVAPGNAWPEATLARLVRRQILGHAGPLRSSARGIAAALAAALGTLERAGLLARAELGITLTAAGRDMPAAAPVRPASFHVGADLALLVPRGLDAATHLELGAVARIEAADVVARYRLEQALVLDALDRGATPSSIEALLERGAPSLPSSVREDVRRWCARFGEVTSHQGIVVTCGPVERHAEFAALVSRSGLSVILIAPGFALVEPNDHVALTIALSASGFSPRRTILSARGPIRPRAMPVARGMSGSMTIRPSVGPASIPSSIPSAPLDTPPDTSLAGNAIGSPPLAPDAAEDAVLKSTIPVAPARLWGERVDAGAGIQAAPPPGAFVARLKEKYRREFGGARLAALDELELDELLALEERGGIRGFLAGKGPGAVIPAPRLEEFTTDEMISVSPVRARQVLEQAMAAGMRCQVGHASRPGQSSRLLIQPLEVIVDGTGTWLRARVAGGRERMLAMERIHAVRVVRT